MTQAILQINKEKLLFWCLFMILILSTVFYMFCNKTIVKNVVQREELESEAIKISLDISNKEFRYISMRNSMTLELAYSMGFKEVLDKIFIKTNSNDVVSYAPKKI